MVTIGEWTLLRNEDDWREYFCEARRADPIEVPPGPGRDEYPCLVASEGGAYADPLVVTVADAQELLVAAGLLIKTPQGRYLPRFMEGEDAPAPGPQGEPSITFSQSYEGHGSPTALFGFGVQPHTGMQVCPGCGGHGKIDVIAVTGDGRFVARPAEKAPPRDADAQGAVWNGPVRCPTCGGGLRAIAGFDVTGREETAAEVRHSLAIVCERCGDIRDPSGGVTHRAAMAAANAAAQRVLDGDE